MRVLHVAQPVDGGVGRYVLDLAVAQRRDGFDVVLASPLGWLADRAAELALPWQRWDAVRSPGPAVARETMSLRGLVRATAPEVVHLHSSKAGVAGRLAMRGAVPTLFQPHGWPWQAVTGAVAAATVGWERLAARWADAVVCVSDAEREAGTDHGVRAAYRVVPNGVDLDRFPAVAPAEAPARRRALGLPDAPLAVCVGRLDEQKGQEVLVRAWPQVRRAVPGATLALVGSGRSADALRALAGSLGVADAVVFAGEREDAPEWYAAADVVAFPSRWGEAMALTPLEAMATGRSVVASDVAGVRESLVDGCGAIVPAGEAEAFAEALVARLADPAMAAEEGRAGRRHAEAALDVRHAHAALRALTCEVAQRGRGRPAVRGWRGRSGAGPSA